MFLQLTLFGPPATQYLPSCLIDLLSAVSFLCKQSPVANLMMFKDVIIIIPWFGSRQQMEIIKSDMKKSFSSTKRLGNLNREDLYYASIKFKKKMLQGHYKYCSWERLLHGGEINSI